MPKKMSKADRVMLTAVIVIAVLAVGTFIIKQGFKPLAVFQPSGHSIRQFPQTLSVEKMPSSIQQTKKEFREVSSFPAQSVIQREIQGFHIVGTGTDGSFCCDTTCSYSCVGSYDYCNAWCDSLPQFQHEQLTCPSGYTLVSGTTKCCPSSNPYYCSTNNLCYTEPNCGAVAVTNPICKSASPEPGYRLDAQVMGQTCVPTSQCVFGGITGACPPQYVESTNPSYSFCNYPIWDASSLYRELDGQFFWTSCANLNDDITCPIFNDNRFPVKCDTCSGNLCVRNNRCTLGEIECLGNNQYYSCEKITLSYFSSPFNDFTRTLKTCPTGTICNVNKCDTDSDGDGFPDSLDQCPNNAPTERVNKYGCPIICGQNEVKLVDGTCKQLTQTCIDNNLNNICDLDDPIVWMDSTNNIPICADRDANRICDGVESLFCKDSNNNKICDSDEIKWLSTYCLDENSNGICDGIESSKIVCDKDIAPICDLDTNITYPNVCFANAYNVINKIEDSCKVAPIIIRRDCATRDVPIPSGYICDFETGWLFRRDVIYQNITIDCRGKQLEGYTCSQVGEDWVWTKTELINIDCYSRGCPKANQLCQSGICVESAKRCPSEIDCKIFGVDATCDEESGLCVKVQFKPTQPISQPKIPLWAFGLFIVIVAGIGFLVWKRYQSKR